eukprot:scaffold13478_cov132-Cylindrotheca_fusiformis.AAC.24
MHTGPRRQSIGSQPSTTKFRPCGPSATVDRRRRPQSMQHYFCRTSHLLASRADCLFLRLEDLSCILATWVAQDVRYRRRQCG